MPVNWRAVFTTSLETIANITFNLVAANHAIVYDHFRYALAHTRSAPLAVMTPPPVGRRPSPKRSLREADPESASDDDARHPSKRHSPSPRASRPSPSPRPSTPSPSQSPVPVGRPRHHGRAPSPAPPSPSDTRSGSPEKRQRTRSSQSSAHARNASLKTAARREDGQRDLSEDMLMAMRLADRLEFDPREPSAQTARHGIKSVKSAGRARRRDEFLQRVESVARARADRKAKKQRLAKQRRRLEREMREKSFRQSKAEYEADLAATLRGIRLEHPGGDTHAGPDAHTDTGTVRKRLLRPLSEAWQAKVKAALAVRSEAAIMGKSVEGVELSRKDIGRLLPPGEMVPGREPWLNDEVINAWYANLCARLNERDGYVKGPNAVPRWVAYGTQWYRNASERGVDSIRGWSRRKGIKNERLLRAERIFFPINEHSHWTLLAVGGRARTIQYLDSMSEAGWLKSRYVDMARRWLAMELGAAYEPAEWRVLRTETAQQCNANDCGVFACLNGLALSTGSADPSADFDSRDMPDARRLFVATLLNGGFTGDFDLGAFGIE